jgi:hypothetical protein
MNPPIRNYKGISVLVEPQQDGSVRAYAAWGNKIHGLAIYKDGKIEFDINKYREIDGCPFSAHFSGDLPEIDNVIGEDLYDSLFNTISSEYPVEMIEDGWLFDRETKKISLNLLQYKKSLVGKENPTSEDKLAAISNTFSGRMAERHGFDEARIALEDTSDMMEHVMVVHTKE